MHYNYKLDKQAITNIIKRYIKPIKKQKQNLSSTTLNLKHPSSFLRITPSPLKYS